MGCYSVAPVSAALRKRKITTPAIVPTGREDSRLRTEAAAAEVAAF